ncbi:hypothetical protein [Asanoa sp. NPDC050611]|uniref:hypothetical protein n=1 Tax=Asanoa sp. NPDC050611 TaxID=3157098 RepID=UPI0033F23ACE
MTVSGGAVGGQHRERGLADLAGAGEEPGAAGQGGEPVELAVPAHEHGRRRWQLERHLVGVLVGNARHAVGEGLPDRDPLARPASNPKRRGSGPATPP